MDAFIDPYTRDYVPDPTRIGDLQRAPGAGLANRVYIRLMLPLGKWWAAPQIGSRLHELAREKDVTRVAVLAKQYAVQALQPLLDDGSAASVDVQVERPGNGRLSLNVTVRDAIGRRIYFNFPVKVG
jgi:phage gp46-like protein